jgi:hypothetical protein
MSQVLSEAASVVAGAETLTGELLATSADTADGMSSAIAAILGRVAKTSIRLSGESELASSDASLASGEGELL